MYSTVIHKHGRLPLPVSMNLYSICAVPAMQAMCVGHLFRKPEWTERDSAESETQAPAGTLAKKQTRAPAPQRLIAENTMLVAFKFNMSRALVHTACQQHKPQLDHSTLGASSRSNRDSTSCLARICFSVFDFCRRVAW